MRTPRLGGDILSAMMHYVHIKYVWCCFPALYYLQSKIAYC